MTQEEINEHGLFKCDSLDCWLTVKACIRRQQHANQTIFRQKQSHIYVGEQCKKCKIGAEHKAFFQTEDIVGKQVRSRKNKNMVAVVIGKTYKDGILHFTLKMKHRGGTFQTRTLPAKGYEVII